MRSTLRLGLVGLAIATCVAAFSSPTSAQDRPSQPPGLPTGVTREQMWPAPTEADWKLPCLIQWQRSWDDAVAISRQTKQPILVCVNMDGEIASEHYAGIRYRQPDIAKLYEPYVCVIASVYRHTPRDHDEQGRRIPCPRFGTVTCGEHIAIEPMLFEKFMDGRRIAPRHIMVELDGKETYDVFYAWDTQSVFDSIRNGIANRKQETTPLVRGDRPILDRVASHDSIDKAAVEAAFVEADAAQRQRLLEAALANPDAAPTDLVRLGVLDLDPQVQELARKALAASKSEGAVDLIAETLSAPIPAADRDSLVGTLDRIGATSMRAKSFANVHKGLSTRSGAVDVDAWANALANASASTTTEGATYSPAFDQQDRVVAGQDADQKIALAEDFLKRAADVEPKFARALVLDAQQLAVDAERLGAKGWRVNAVLAVAAHSLGDAATARTRAEAAVGSMPTDVQDWNAMAVLALFAQARQKAIADAVVAKQEWPPQWLTDLNAAYAVLARHPFGNDAHVAAHYDFLRWFKARRQANQVLEAGIARFADSWMLHERLRTRVLEEQGLDGLEPTYAKLVEAAPTNAATLWYAGFASAVAAEYERRFGDLDAALRCYDHASALYDRARDADPAIADSSDTQAAIAIGAKARVALERGDDANALAWVLASLDRKESAGATQDGLNLTTIDTAKMLRARLRETKQDAAAETLEAKLRSIDPTLLELPAYEREVPPPPPPAGP
ncbi:MAG: hypothetical protein JNL94_09620 [Planctomycetes bacterium]|nr:hypothetical protein [Planctomycetota bacterium]